MATKNNGIATEGEAKSKIGSSSDVTTNLAITKLRLQEIGGQLVSGVSYADNQCVKYSDIYVYVPPAPTLYYWYTTNTLMKSQSSVYQSSAPIPDERYDAYFDGSWSSSGNDRYASYTPFNTVRLLEFYECNNFPQQGNFNIPQSVDAAKGNMDLILFSSALPLPNSLYNSTFNTVYTQCLNTPNLQFNGANSLLNEFPNISSATSDLLRSFLGSIYSGGNNSQILWNNYGNTCRLNMVFGQEFYILYYGSGDFTEMSISMSIQNGKISEFAIGHIYTDDLTLVAEESRTFYINYNYRSGQLEITTLPIYEESYSVFELVIMKNTNNDTLLAKFRRITNGSEKDPLYVPYITDIVFNAKPQPLDPINLIYNYDAATWWKNKYSVNQDNPVLGLDSLAMYQIRFITDVIDENGTYKLPNAANLSFVKDDENKGFDLQFGNSPATSMKPYFSDYCIPNPQFTRRGITTHVLIKGLGLTIQDLFIDKIGFAISYLRSPVHINFEDNVANHDLPAVYGDTFDYTGFLYEQALSAGHFDKRSVEQKITTNLDEFTKIYSYSLNSDVPYIIIEELDDNFSHTFIYDYFKSYVYIEDWTLYFGDHWWGIPEFVFFMDDKQDYHNMVEILDRPRAVQITISLSKFGAAYNKFHDNLGDGLVLDKLYIYYKSFYYRYDFI